MNNNSIERMLEINTRIEKGNIASKKSTNGGHRVANQQDLDKLIEDYDRQVYGPIPKPILKEGEQEKYDARKEMERLKEIDAHGGRSAVNLEGRNIPQGIVESILNNPLDLKPIDPRMDALEEKLKDNMPGIKAAANILERVEKREEEARAKIAEQIIPQTNTNTNIDYELIKTIIEYFVDNDNNVFECEMKYKGKRKK